MKKFTLFTVLFSLCAISYSTAQVKEKQQAQFETTYNQSKAIVQSQDYSFVGEMVYEDKTRERLNSESNTIVIQKSQVSGTLASLTSEGEIFNLNGSIQDYKVSFSDDTQEISIQFKVKSESNFSEVQIDVKPNGNAFLEFKSLNSSASYTGKIKRG